MLRGYRYACSEVTNMVAASKDTYIPRILVEGSVRTGAGNCPEFASSSYHLHDSADEIV